LEILKDTLIAEVEGDDVKQILDKCVKSLKAQLVDKKEKSLSMYSTPYGTFELKIETKKLDVMINENEATYI